MSELSHGGPFNDVPIRERETVQRWPAARRVVTGWNGRIGATIVGLVLVTVIIGPLVTPQDPLAQNLAEILKGPSWSHPLGTDDLGRDVLTRLFYGGRSSLAIAAAAVGLAILGGLVLGTIAATYSRVADIVIMRLVDAMLAFPVLILAIAISITLGHGRLDVIVAIAVVNLPVFARLACAQTLRIKQQQYMVAAELMGASRARRILRHVVPNLINPFIVQGTVAFSFAIIIEAALSFLGLGVQAPTPDWGQMISVAKIYLTISPHMLLAPAGAIFVTVLGLNLLGDGLSDALDPRQAQR